MLENQSITLLKHLTSLLSPWLEVSIFSAKLHHLLESWNPLSHHKQDCAFPAQMPETVIIETLANGKKTKTHYIAFDDNELGNTIVRFRFDMTWFANGFDEIKRFMGETQAPLPSESQSWENTANQQIESFLVGNKLNIDALTRLEKRELILCLYEKGLLHYKDSTAWLANRLHLSRATVYNHLNWAKSIRKIHIHQVDAFSDAPFSGNPAGVVLDADDLEEDTMRSITREMNNAETAFVLSSESADCRMRYFTPTGQEMVFCGHSTVGALYMLAKEKRLNMGKTGTYQFEVETLAGMLQMGCGISDEGNIKVNFTSPVIHLEETPHTHGVIAEILSIPLSNVNTKHKLYYEKTNKDLYITVKDLKALESIESDPKTVAKFCKNNDITVICVLTPHAFSDENHIHMRCFAPAVGINEDLFTGSVIGGLVAYAHKNKIITKDKGEIGIEQGHFLSRPGTVKVKYAFNKGEYKAQVFAKANHFFSTEIQLNARNE
ncbi:MAG: PhzF family phenazine biosynthesis isomerase [Gammaproteobacteria bacterium]|jgi:PhzF family phenazine biosynthesis protein|nr:PhzF family phenazine biosynthesis isomerase [Gammaproteobacteria bacterium]